MAEQAPAEARSGPGGLTIEWLVIPEGEDPVIAGAHWAFSWALDRFFGPVLSGALFDELTGVEQYTAAGWVPLSSV